MHCTIKTWESDETLLQTARATCSLTNHAQYSGSLADGRNQVLIEDLILWRMKLLQFHQGGEHHVELVPLCEQVRHRQQLHRDITVLFSRDQWTIF